MNICVTGVSRGLGAALCQSLMAQGHTVWGVARSEPQLREMARHVIGGSFFWSCVDIADTGSVAAWRQAMSDASFVPDILVLNASVQLDDMADGYNENAGNQVLRTNMQGTLLCVSAFLPDFLARNKGTIAVIASTAALRPSTRSASYAASKAGIVMAFRSFRLRFYGTGVQFKTVILGPIATSMWEGKKSPLVPPVSVASGAIGSFLFSRRDVLYYPYISTWLLRLSQFFPDQFFAAVSNVFLK
ncbi:MAG: putative short-chain dehydrogenase [Candidatus Peribacteria bacterium]|nr:putative short-chain dehydrogenase [Candidatus Peribacteria bacterium]